MLRYPFTTTVLQARLAVIAVALGAILALPSCADDDDDTAGDTQADTQTDTSSTTTETTGGTTETTDTGDTTTTDSDETTTITGADSDAETDGVTEPDTTDTTDTGDTGDTGDATDTGDTADTTDTGDATDTGIVVPDELFGLWESNFGGNEGFSDTEFYGTGYGSFIRYVDAASRVLVTQNRPDDMFSPDKFSKVLWTAPASGSLYYCTVDFGLDTLQDALDSTVTADATNPATSGCGGFAWTKLTQIETFGVWDSNFGGTETIDRTIWSYSELRAFSNSERWAVTQNKADDMFNPSKFNRFVWTAITGGSFYYCTVDFGLATLNDALASTKTADDSDPDNTGCGGFSWTKLSTPK